MVLYECKCCNFNSNLKGNYIRHLNTKNHDNKISSNIVHTCQ